jgi:predicted ferric reductase
MISESRVRTAKPIEKPYRLSDGRGPCRIVALVPGPAAARIELVSTGAGINFHPGQFRFLSVQAEVQREPHPFTLAGAEATDGRVV